VVAGRADAHGLRPGGNGVTNLWLYRLDGSAPAALTAAAAGSATPLGYRAAWRVSTGPSSKRPSVAASDRWPC
jgi:hypothetical protein